VATERWAIPELWSPTREHRLPRRTLRGLPDRCEGDMDFAQLQTLLEPSLPCRQAPAEASVIPAHKENSYLLVYFLLVYFWVFPRRQIVVGRRFGTLYHFHLQRLGEECEVCQAKPNQSSNCGRRLARSASRRPPVC